MADAMNVFDRRLVGRHRDRAAAGFSGHDFLVRAVAERLADRLDDVRRRFQTALDLGCHGGQMQAALRGRDDISILVQTDLSPAMLHTASGLRVAADEEWLPFAEGAFDLVLSCLSLHWVNDLPGALLQARRALKPDGLFLAAILGGETLKELRQALMRAEIETTGGASPRLSPFADVRDAGALLQRAGFALPVVDSETLTVSYPSPLALLHELRGMGETNAVLARRRTFTGRRTLLAAFGEYETQFAGPDGRVPATFQVITMTGWAPDPESQQRPLRPGSASQRLADALGTDERPTADEAAP